MMAVGGQMPLSLSFLSTIANPTCELAVRLGLNVDFVRLHTLLSVKRCYTANVLELVTQDRLR